MQFELPNGMLNYFNFEKNFKYLPVLMSFITVPMIELERYTNLCFK